MIRASAGLTALLLLAAPTQAMQLPADAGALNVRDFGAVGDGRHDDTAALMKAVSAAGTDTGSRFWQTRIVYLPDGTYLVSGTLTKRYADGRFGSGMVLIGQSRSGTVIRLADHAPGFQDPAAPRGVVMTASKLLDGTATSGGKDYTGKGEGNDAYDNFVEDLTVDVGHGNPGAIGIDYLGNNIGAIRDVTVSALAGSGATGISMRRKWPGPALLQRVTVHGFQTGIAVCCTEYGVTLDHVSLAGQRETGITNDGNAVSAAHLAIEGAPSPVVNAAPGGLITLVDSPLPKPARGPGTTAASLVELPDAPAPPDDPPSRWVNVLRFAASSGDRSDITTALGQAMATGAATVYLPYGRYVIHNSLAIPPTLRRLISMNASISVIPARDAGFARTKGMLRVDQPGPPIEIDGVVFDMTDLGDQLAVGDDADRVLVMRDIVTAGTTLLDRGRSGGPVFIEDVCCGPLQIAGPAPVRARQLDIEWGAPYLLNDGSPLEILGLKTEGDGVVIDNRAGARSLVLGGLLYVVRAADRAVPAFRNIDASLTASFVEEAFGAGNRYTRYVEGSQTVLAAAFPRHGGYGRVVAGLVVGSAAR